MISYAIKTPPFDGTHLTVGSNILHVLPPPPPVWGLLLSLHVQSLDPNFALLRGLKRKITSIVHLSLHYVHLVSLDLRYVDQFPFLCCLK